MQGESLMPRKKAEASVIQTAIAQPLPLITSDAFCHISDLEHQYRMHAMAALMRPITDGPPMDVREIARQAAIQARAMMNYGG